MSDRNTSDGDWSELDAILDEAPEPALETPAAEPAQETPPASAAPAVADTVVPVVEPTGQPNAAPAPQAPASVPAPPVVSAEPIETPYALRADGRELPIPGVVKLPDGSLKVPAQSFNALARHLADRTEVQRKHTEYQRQLAERDESLSSVTAVKDQLLEMFQQVLNLSPEQRDQWCEDKVANFPNFVAQSRERELQQREARLRQQEDEAEFARMAPQLEPQWKQGLAGYVQRIAEQDGLTGLDPVTVAEVAWAWKDHGLLTRAPEDIPSTGTRKGQMAVALPLLRQIIHQEARLATEKARLRAEWEAEQARKGQQAAATVANAAAAAPPKAPPTVAATKGRTVRFQERTQPRRPDGTFAPTDDAGDWDREMLRADLSG